MKEKRLKDITVRHYGQLSIEVMDWENRFTTMVCTGTDGEPQYLDEWVWLSHFGWWMVNFSHWCDECQEFEYSYNMMRLNPEWRNDNA